MNKKYISLALATILFSACGGSSKSSNNNGNGSIDLKEYYPNKSMTKTFIHTQSKEEGKNKSHYNQIVQVSENTITFTEETEIIEKVVFSDKNITTIMDGKTESRYRHVNIGDILFEESFYSIKPDAIGTITEKLNLKCKIKSQETNFEKGDNIYSGDLLQIECIKEGEVTYDVKPELIKHLLDLNGTHSIYDTSYIYVQKGLGEIVSLNDDCIVDEEVSVVIDDRKEVCVKKHYDYEFYLP